MWLSEIGLQQILADITPEEWPNVLTNLTTKQQKRSFLSLLEINVKHAVAIDE